MTPNIANIYVGESVRFTATVLNSTNGAVIWSLSGTGCTGPACGTISDTGLYTAPPNAPSPAIVTVKAASAADDTKSASATVTVLEAASNTWAWVSGSNSVNQEGVYGARGIPGSTNVPGGRSEALSWFDSGGKLWLFGGLGRDSAGLGDARLNDLWNFDLATLEWTWASGNSSGNQGGVYGTKGIADPSNVPGARTGAVSWVDSQGKLWLFGGYGFEEFASPGQLNDLWKYFK